MRAATLLARASSVMRPTPATRAERSSHSTSALPTPERPMRGLDREQQQVRLVLAVFHDAEAGAVGVAHGDDGVGVAMAQAAQHALAGPAPAEAVLDAGRATSRRCRARRRGSRSGSRRRASRCSSAHSATTATPPWAARDALQRQPVARTVPLHAPPHRPPRHGRVLCVGRAAALPRAARPRRGHRRRPRQPAANAAPTARASSRRCATTSAAASSRRAPTRRGSSACSRRWA